MKNKVAWFEIPASDFQKAKKFYEAVFDWKIDLWGDEGAMATTTRSIKIRIRLSQAGSTEGSISANPKTSIRQSSCKRSRSTRR